MGTSASAGAGRAARPARRRPTRPVKRTSAPAARRAARRQRAVAGDDERHARAARRPRSRRRRPSRAPGAQATSAYVAGRGGRLARRSARTTWPTTCTDVVAAARRARAGAPAATRSGRRSRRRCCDQAALVQRQRRRRRRAPRPGCRGSSARTPGSVLRPWQRVQSSPRRVEARPDRADEPVVVQVQDDARAPASRAAASARQPSVGIEVVGVRRRVRRCGGPPRRPRRASSPPRSSRDRGARAPSRALSRSSSSTSSPRCSRTSHAQVGDRALLAAGGAVAVVQEEDHARPCNARPSARMAADDGRSSIPTRRPRRRYLDVALALDRRAGARRRRGGRSSSTTGRTPSTRAVAERHGARYVAHDGAARAQRRAQHRRSRATAADLLVFVDDDVEVRPGLARRAARAPRAALPGRRRRARPGPIHARFEDHRLRTLRPRGPADHRLDLGPDGRRRRPRLGGEHGAAPQRDRARRAASTSATVNGGDEQEWQAAAARRRRAHPLRRGRGARPPPRRRRRPPALALRAPRTAAAARAARFDDFAGRRPRCAASCASLAGCAAAHGPRPLRERARHGRALRSAACARRCARDARAAARPEAPTTSCRARAGTVGGRRGRCARVARRRARPRRDRAAARARLGRAARQRPASASSCSAIVRDRHAAPAGRDAPSCERSRHDVDDRTSAASGPRQVREPQRAARRHAARTASTGCWSSTTTSTCRAASSTCSCRAPSAAGCVLAQPAHRRRSHAAWALTRRRPRSRGARRRRSSRSARSPRFTATTLRDAAAVPATLRMGWGLDAHWARGRPRARLADRHRRRDAGRPHLRARRRTPTRRERGARRGARVPRRPAVRPRDEVATLASHRGEGLRRRRVLPARRRPGARRLGAPPGARRPRRRRRGPRRSCCTGRCRRRRPAPRPPAGAPRAALAAAPAQPSTASTVGYVPLPVAPPRSRSYGSLGRVGGAAARAALRRLRREFPFDLVHAHNAVPAGDAVRRAAVGRPAASSPSTAATSSYTAPRHGAGAAAVRATFGAARLVLANSAGIARRRPRTGRARRAASSASAPTCRSPRAAAASRRSSPSRTSSARKRHADVLRAVWAAARQPPGPALPDRRRRPGARAAASALATELGVADRVEFAGQLAHAEALERARAAHAVRDAEHRRGVRRRLRRGDGRRRCPRSAASASRARRRSRRAGDGIVARPAGRRRGARRRDRASWPATRARCATSAPAARDTVARALHLGAPAARATVAAYEEARADDDPRPSCSSRTTCRPTASARFAALHERVADRARAVRRPLAPRDGRRRRTPACRTAASPSARSTRLAASGRYRAVVAGTAGRARAARRLRRRAPRAGTPFVLWSALWAHAAQRRRTWPGARCCARLYRDADAVVAYGPHVAALRPRAAGARRVVVAPQAVDDAFWSRARRPPRRRRTRVHACSSSAATARAKGLRRARRGLARLRLGSATRRSSSSVPGHPETRAGGAAMPSGRR